MLVPSEKQVLVGDPSPEQALLTLGVGLTGASEESDDLAYRATQLVTGSAESGLGAASTTAAWMRAAYGAARPVVIMN